MKEGIQIIGVAAVLVGLGSMAVAKVNIETVHVGNPGNAADTEIMIPHGTTGYGAVNYEYRIGKYEVTAGQYCEFLRPSSGDILNYLPPQPTTVRGANGRFQVLGSRFSG